MNNGIILGNKIIDVVFLATITAQFIKVISPIFKGEGINFSKFFETGGMPSSHSASVTSLCTAIAMKTGTKTPLFSVVIVFSMIVMYDATGIRREAGKHAKALNYIILNSPGNLFKSQEFKSFKEFLGHSPLEVLAGAIYGVIVAILCRGYIL